MLPMDKASAAKGIRQTAKLIKLQNLAKFYPNIILDAIEQ